MNCKRFGILTVALIAVPLAAGAQILTLDYQSNALTGNTSFYSGPQVTPFTTQQEYSAAFTTTPFIGSLTATLAGSLGGDLSGLIDVTGVSSSGTPFNWGFNVNAESLGGDPLQFSTFAGSSGGIDLTTQNGVITGAIMNIDFSSYHGPSMSLTVGPYGDSVSFTQGGSEGLCTYVASGGGGNPCTVVASSTSAGAWLATQAPEIDPASAASGLTLLLGGLAVMRGRRTKPTMSA
jgi:hypothetical protein